MEELVHRPQTSFTFDFVPNQVNEIESSVVYTEPPKKQAPNTEIPSLITNASVLFKHSENELAFALVRQALKIDSGHPEALKHLAHYHSASKNWVNSIRVLEALVKRDYCFENIVQLAEKYYLIGKDKLALKYYDEALSILLDASPLLFELYKNMGNIHCKLGDFSAAEEYYCKAFTINAKSDTLLVNLGTLEIQKHDFDAALIKFRAAIEVNSNNDKAWVGLAIVHDQMGDFDLARANIENALDLESGNRTAVHIYSAWGLRDQQYLGPIDALQNYLSTVEQDEEMSLALIHLFCVTEQFDLALIEIERVLLWNPHQEEVIQLYEKLARGR